MFVLRMGEITDCIEVFGIAWRTADIFWRTTTGGVEQEGKSLCHGVVEPFFEFDHMVPAVTEVIEIMDRLGARLSNDIAEPRLAGIDRLMAVIVAGIRNPPTDLTSEELEEMAICPAKRRLERQMQPTGTTRRRITSGFTSLRVTLIRTAVVLRLMPPASDRVRVLPNSRHPRRNRQKGSSWR